MSRRVAWRCDREEPAEGVIGPGLRVGRIYLRAHMSVDGTFETCRRTLKTSAFMGRSEVIGARPLLGEKIARHTKPNAMLKKADRPAHRVIAKSRFAALETIYQVIQKLLGV